MWCSISPQQSSGGKVSVKCDVCGRVGSFPEHVDLSRLRLRCGVIANVVSAAEPSTDHKPCSKCQKDKEKLNSVVPGLGDATEKVIDVLTFGHGHELGRMLRGDD